jgi:DNA-binding NtrC family response regulator
MVKSMVSILLVDDDPEWLQGIKRTLHSHNVTGREHIHLARNGDDMFAVLANRHIDLIILDLFLEKESGEDLLVQILAKNPQQRVIIMTGSNSVENAVECMKKGATDYFIKSTPVSELVANLKRIVRIRALELENEFMRNLPRAGVEYGEFADYVTQSPQVYALFDYIRSMVKSSQHILITGESGVGKGVFARMAAQILRPGKPFVSVNVAGYDDHMFADALFGHVKGAYTGAERAREGMIRQAEGGVLFLDEIGDLSAQSQVKLLYLLQDGEYPHLGADAVLRASVKFIFASNQDLSAKLREKKFRNDLFFRLNTHRIHIPPLRQRREDIPLLVRHFAGQTANELGKSLPIFSDAFMESIQAAALPGNVRQLRSIIYDLVTRHQGVITEEQLQSLDIASPVDSQDDSAAALLPVGAAELPTVDKMTNRLVELAMQKAGGNQIKAAHMLQISQPTLSRRLKRLKDHS